MIKKIHTFKKRRIIEFLLYFFIFFPYITVFTKTIDTAPYALCFSLAIYIFMKDKRLPWEVWILFLLFLLALITLMPTGLNFTSLRLLAGYFSIFIIASSTYFVLKSNNEVNIELIYKFFLFWFFVGVIQSLVYPEFLTSLIVRSSTSEGRGVTGLAPEPTYYATVMIFFIIVIYIMNYKVTQTLCLGLLSIIYFSMSITGVLIFFSIFVFYICLFIFNKKTLFLVMVVCFILSVVMLNYYYFEGTRLYKLLKILLDNPVQMFFSDASGNARISHIIGGFLGSFDNYLLPNLNNNTRESLQLNSSLYSEFLQTSMSVDSANRIMSGTGQMFYNLGIISLLYYYSLFSLAFKHFQSIKISVFLTVSLFIIMTTAIPLTFPIFGFIYGLLAFEGKGCGKNKLSQTTCLNARFRCCSSGYIVPAMRHSLRHEGRH